MPISFSIFYPSNNLLLLLYIYYYPPHISMVHSGEKKKNLNGNPMLNIKQINSEDAPTILIILYVNVVKLLIFPFWYI